MKLPNRFESLPAGFAERAYPSNMTLFTGNQSFFAGTSASETYYQWVLYLTLEGEVTWSMDGQQVVSRRGHLMLVRPGVDISWNLPADASPWELAWAIFQPRAHWHEWLSDAEYQAGVAGFQIEDEAVLAQMARGMKTAHRVYTRSAVGREEWALLAIERVLLTLRSHYLLKRDVPDTRVQQALQFIHAHSSQALTVQEIASHVHLSESHLTALFRKQMGTAPMAYLERVRLTRAGEMLHFGSASVADVARALGYVDPEYFSRRFRLFTGQTPREFRKSPAAGAVECTVEIDRTSR